MKEEGERVDGDVDNDGDDVVGDDVDERDEGEDE